MRPEPVDFTDALTGPVSPAFSIPFNSYALTRTGLKRIKSASGTENGIDRPVIRTVSPRYGSRDFVFAVGVTIPENHGDIAYVGFGAGETNAALDNEPTRALLFRIHNLPSIPFFQVDIVIGDPKGGRDYQGQYRRFERFEKYTPGKPMRFEIVRRGDTVTLAAPAIPSARVEFAANEFRNLFTDDEAYVFLANSSEGTTFTNASLTSPSK